MTDSIHNPAGRRRVFNDDALEQRFAKDGYVTVPFLNNEDALLMKQDLSRLAPSDNFKGNQKTLIGQQSFHVTFFDNDRAYKQEVFDYAAGKFKTISGRLLHDYKCAQANVFMKPPHSGFVYPHQNLTITDEKRYTSVSFWLPLQDTDFENGTICLIPGSQKGFVKYRNTHIYWPYVQFFKEGKGLHYFKPVNVKAGDLLILDDRVIHYTPLNNSKAERWVLHALWAPAEAPIWFCDPAATETTVYKVQDDFWQFHSPGEFPAKNAPSFVLKDTEIVMTENVLDDCIRKLRQEANDAF